MNYPVRVGIIDYLKKQGTDALYYALTEVTNNAPKRIRDMQMNLLGTHDTQRIITTLAGESPKGRSNRYLATKRMNEEETSLGVKRVKMAYSILATIPGIPAIFYGDEAGLEGYHDPFCRRPYPWGREDKALLAYYKRLGAIRAENEVLAEGEFSLVAEAPHALAFSRKNEKGHILVAANCGDEPLVLALPMEAKELLTGKRVKHTRVAVARGEVFIWRLQ